MSEKTTKEGADESTFPTPVPGYHPMDLAPEVLTPLRDEPAKPTPAEAPKEPAKKAS